MPLGFRKAAYVCMILHQGNPSIIKRKWIRSLGPFTAVPNLHIFGVP